MWIPAYELTYIFCNQWYLPTPLPHSLLLPQAAFQARLLEALLAAKVEPNRLIFLDQVLSPTTQALWHVFPCSIGLCSFSIFPLHWMIVLFTLWSLEDGLIITSRSPYNPPMLRKMPHGDYLTVVCGVDVTLDPFPFGGGVTLTDSLSCPSRNRSSRNPGSKYDPVPFVTSSLLQVSVSSLLLFIAPVCSSATWRFITYVNELGPCE